MTTTDTPTTTSLDAVLDRYFAAWNEPDRGARVELLAEAFTDGAHYVDPLADVAGPDAIADMIEGVRAQFAGATLQCTGDVDAHHDVARFPWNATGPDGAVLVAGIDVVVLGDDGRISALAGFFG
jgi:hypothetical protein